MKTAHYAWLTLIFSVMLSWGSGAHALPGALSYVPADAEVVIGVNSRQINDSDILKKIMELRPALVTRVTVLENLTGINLLRDIDRVYCYGRLKDNNSVGVIFQGRIDQQKLLALLQINPQYKSLQVGNLTVHSWYDSHDKRVKFGAFIAGDQAAIWNSQAAMEASLAAATGGAASFANAPEARLIPADADLAAGWGVLVSRQTVGPAAKYHIATAQGLMTFKSGGVSLLLTLTPDAQEAVPKWVEVWRGLIAFGLVQPDRPALKEIAGRSQAGATGDGKSAMMEINIDQQTIVDIINKRALAHQ